MRALAIALLLTVCPFSYGQSHIFLSLHDVQRWQQLSYNNIPANEIQFSDNRLTIQVDSSASPLIYPFSQPRHIQLLSMNLSVDGYLNLQEQRQGEGNSDDFIFRIGVVYEGDKRLNAFQKAFAPDWIQTLFRLAPENTGVGYIHFFNVYSDDRLSLSQRIHPASELIAENFQIKRSDGQMLLEFQPETDQKVLALWISSDGDDTASNYQIELSNLSVQSK